jgi:hypothetical protein
MKWAGHAACMGQKTSSHKSFCGQNCREKDTMRPRHRWKDIKMDLKETGCEGVDYIYLA